MSTKTTVEPEAPSERLDRLYAHAERFIAAWNSQDVARVVACYTPDVVYRDANTRGEINGSEAFGRYLTKLFDTWQMHWTVKQVFPIEGEDGSAALWTAEFRRPGRDGQVLIDGMDLVLLEGDLIRRNEVYFDKTPLLALMSG